MWSNALKRFCGFRKGIQLPKTTENSGDQRREIAEKCQRHGIAEASWVMKATNEELQSLAELAKDNSFPELDFSPAEEKELQKTLSS